VKVEYHWLLTKLNSVSPRQLWACPSATETVPSKQVKMTSSIQTSVRYLKNDHELAVYKASIAGGDLVPHTGNYMDHTVSVCNGRELANQLDLDQEGFRLVDQPTQVSDFYQNDQLGCYESELKILLNQTTGSSEIRIFDHTRRSASADVRSSRNIREASSVIHNDYSDKSGHVRLRDYLNTTNNANDHELLERDFAIVNVWRTANATIVNHHLAMCIASSAPASDLVSVKREGKERMGELQLMLHNSAHRWFYFPHMTHSEALIFKTFDSRKDGRARFTPHTAIEDPTAPADAPPRESIETRCFVFF